MAYTKTVWDNDVTAVDETNMNKIETGLFDQDARLFDQDARLFDQDARITVVEAEASGWTVAPGTWTYASASRINTSVDLRGVIRYGDKIKLTQTTNKYYKVENVTSTYIDINVNFSKDTVANAAITNPYYSHQENPMGYGDTNSLTVQTQVRTGVNLNNFKTSGRYPLYGANTNGATTTIGVLDVLAYSGDWIQQVWWRIDATNECWTRTFLSGTTWTAWTKRW